MVKDSKPLLEKKTYQPKFAVIIIILITAITWSSSLSNEFTGYDDIKLIVDNNHLQQGIIHCLIFFWNTFSGSFNTAWSDFPTIIYRPLEQYAIAFGYQIWGTSAWHYHFFFNYLLHITNSVLVFFILKSFIKDKLALVITCIWAVHPLHHEALNMLTSGAGFLLAHCFLLIAVLLFLRVSTKQSKLDYFITLFLATTSLFISYLGSEMTVIAIPVLAIILSKFPTKAYWLKLGLASLTLILYLIQRSNVINLDIKNSSHDFLERSLVLAPQLWTNYLKLYFFPVKLSIDEQHNLILADSFSEFHILALILSLVFIYLIIFFWKEKTIASSLIISILAISFSLGLIPAYCLARDRYTYIFSLALTIALVLIASKYINPKILSYIAVIITIGLASKSWLKNLDWQNGEKLWSSTIDSITDLGAKQVWRYRLLQYYENPGTQTFKASLLIKKRIEQDFNSFVVANNLQQKTTLEDYLSNQGIKHKYSYNTNKSIASGIFSLAMHLKKQKKYQEMIPLLRLAHFYHPSHFQTNLQLFVWDKTLSESLIDGLYQDAQKHPIFAKSLLDSLYILKDPRHKEYATCFNQLYPKTSIFKTHLEFAKRITNAK